jgi:hypothetical protein
MDIEASSEDDPESPHWGNLVWSTWYSLEETGDGRGLVPTEQGIYRVRCCSQGDHELIYVGISTRGLRSRISSLRNGEGHSAAHCVAVHAKARGKIEVSWAILANVDKRELMGREVDFIAAYRRRFKRSPACQFHGSPVE